MIRTVILNMRSSESLIYCGGKWQLLQLNKIGFFNWDARENRCCWDNNNKIHHQRTSSFLITRGVKIQRREKEGKGDVDSSGNKIRGIVTKDMERVKGLDDFSASGFALAPGLCWIPSFGQPLSVRRSYCQASLQLSQTSQLGVPTHSLSTQIPLEIPETAGSTSALSRECKKPRLWLALVMPANLSSQWARKEKFPSWTCCSCWCPQLPFSLTTTQLGKTRSKGLIKSVFYYLSPFQAPVTGVAITSRGQNADANSGDSSQFTWLPVKNQRSTKYQPVPHGHSGLLPSHCSSHINFHYLLIRKGSILYLDQNVKSE